MSSYLSILNLMRIGLLAIMLTNFASSAEVRALAHIRQYGASLDTSLRNEATHAMTQTLDWLLAQQLANGEWQSSNSVQSTSLVLCTLYATNQNRLHSDAATRAALWLNQSITNQIPDLETHAWRLLALSLTLPQNVTQTVWLNKLARQADFAARTASEDTRRFWHRVRVSVGLEASSDTGENRSDQEQLAELAKTWPPTPYPPAEQLWQLAQLINRVGAGQLVYENTPRDWRTDLARYLINSQRYASIGGGYWLAPAQHDPIIENAFCILTLLEL